MKRDRINLYFRYCSNYKRCCLCRYHTRLALSFGPTPIPTKAYRVSNWPFWRGGARRNTDECCIWQLSWYWLHLCYDWVEDTGIPSCAPIGMYCLDFRCVWTRPVNQLRVNWCEQFSYTGQLVLYWPCQCVHQQVQAHPLPETGYAFLTDVFGTFRHFFIQIM
jgi:hypothetical protein